MLSPVAALVLLDVMVPHLTAARTPHAPVIDGELDDDAWKMAGATDAFVQVFPLNRAAPSERTTLRVLYDDSAIYFGFDCEQLHSPMVERLTRRDHDSESEWVWIQLDSRNDGKNAFMFAVNISGVLADGQLLNQNTFAWEWDENWEARTARTAHGWTAEIRIPLRVLRFDSHLPVQSWGMQASRFIAERQEQNLWAYVPREAAAPISYFGRLDDLRDLEGGGSVELRPFVLGRGRRRSPVADVVASGYDSSASAGLDLKLHVGPDLTLDGAIFPDFAQVEADQVILNLSNYETFFPEKRPIFLEGGDVFSFPVQVFYTRRIGAAPLSPALPDDQKLVDVPDPATIYGAAKLVGRLTPSWSIGAVSALTARNEVSIVRTTAPPPAMPIVPTSELTAPLTAFNVLRLKREFGGAGHIGIIGTGSTTFHDTGPYPNDGTDTTTGQPRQRCPTGDLVPNGSPCFHDSYVGGVDALWRSSSGDYVAGAALIETWIHGGSPRTLRDGTIVAPGDASTAGWVRVAKEGGKPLIASAEYTGLGRTADYNDVGFMPRQNLHELKGAIGYRTVETGELTVETLTQLQASQRLNLAGMDLGQLYELGTRIRFRNFWTMSAAADFAPTYFDDREVGDGSALERGRWGGLKAEVDSDPRGRIFATVASQVQLISEGAYAFSAQGSAVLHLLPQFDVELMPAASLSAGEWRYAFNAANDPPAGNYPFGRLTARTVSATLRVSYTFTPQVSLQAYAQGFLASGHYSDTRTLVGTTPGSIIHRADIEALPQMMLGTTPDFEEAALNVNVVFRWEYRLGSTFFLVYSRSQIPAVDGLTGNASLDWRALGNRAAADVLLFKLSYWWAS